MHDHVERGYTALGVFGHVARMVVFGLIGYFLVKAALDFNPDEAVALDGALAQLAKAPYGPVLLGIVAAGLIGFGAFSLVESRSSMCSLPQQSREAPSGRQALEVHARRAGRTDAEAEHAADPPRPRVSRTSTRAPRPSARLPNAPCSLTDRPRRTRRTTLRNGHPGPEQRTSMRVPFGRSRAVSVRLTVRRPNGAPGVADHAAEAEEVDRLGVAVLVDVVVARARARRDGWPRVPSSQSCGRGDAVAVAVEVVASTPEQSSSTPLSGTSGAPGRIPGLVSSQSAGRADAVAVGVALDLLAGDPGVGVVADRGVGAAAAVDLLAAPVRAPTLPRLAVEDVDPAAAEQPVVARGLR